MSIWAREGREGKIKVKVRAKGDQAGGIEDPGAAVRLVRKVGRVTSITKEKRVKWFPIKREKVRDTPCRLQEQTVRVRSSCITAL